MGNIRQTAKTVHRWLGLTVGMVGVYIALTGAWIIFKPQLEPHTDAYMTIARTCDHWASLDDMIVRAREAYPQSPLASVWPEGDPHASLRMRYSDNQQVYFDPCTGQLLGLRSRWAGTFGTAEYLHRFRFVDGGAADVIPGTVAAVMAFGLALVGLFLWWPRRRNAWARALRIEPGLKGRARDRNHHVVTGALVSLILIVVAGSGVTMAFGWAEALLYTLTGSEELAPRKVPAPVPVASLKVDAAWHNVLAALSERPQDASIRLPKKPNAAIMIYLTEAGSPNPEGRTYFYADPASGKIIEYIPYAETPTGRRLTSWLLAFHKGEVAAPFGQIVNFLVMLAVAYLGFTGVRSYIRSRRPAPAAGTVSYRQLRVRAVRDEAEGVKAFELIDPSGEPLPAFTPGSHVTVRTPSGLLRQYSLCNGPADTGHYEIAVHLAQDSRGGSRAMHGLKAGDVLMVSDPRNQFPIAGDTHYGVLLAGGIGITPLLSMARHFRAQGTPFEIHYFGRTREAMAFRDLLTGPRFGEPTHIHAGKAPEEVRDILEATLGRRPAGAHIYTCGPTGFMDMVETVAAQADWPENAVHRENFSPVGTPQAGTQAAFDVRLARSGRTLTIEPGQTILNALAMAGCAPERSCEQGLCGTCAVRVLSGDIDHRDSFLSDAERARGDLLLACVSRAKGQYLVLDL